MKRLLTLTGIALCLPLLATDAPAGGGNYFHVDDFSGLPAGFAPIQGTQSLWCGRRAGPDFCEPGTGHNWDECWESCEFGVTGDMTFEFDIAYDSEPSYDYTVAQYLDQSNTWMTLGHYDGNGMASESFVVPAGLLGPTVKFRFRFRSDNGWDNEDCLSLFQHGACFIDNVSVKAGATVVNSENFESEPPMARETQSGIWVAGAHPGCNPVRVEPTTWGKVKSLYR